MLVRRGRRRTSSAPFWAVAFLVHGLALLLFLFLEAPRRRAPAEPEYLLIRLAAPPEGAFGAIAKSPEPPPAPSSESEDEATAPPPQEDPNVPPTTGDQPISPAAIAELESERDKLRAELAALKQSATASMTARAEAQQGMSAVKEARGEGPKGAVRELDLSGHPEPVVEQIMARYRFRVVEKMVKAGSNQNFLSSASSDGGQYFGGVPVPTGVYEVFELSRESVAKMARLEEAAIREKGMDPLKSRVVRIVFGIVKDAEGKHDLGVLTFEAEPVP